MSQAIERVVVVLTDHDPDDSNVLTAVNARAQQSPASFVVLRTNPAAHEAHVVHPQRHDLVDAARARAPQWAAALTQAAGSPVEVVVSIRHNPYDALEEFMLDRHVDEVVHSVRHHALADRLHLDLAHRLRHLPVISVDATTLTG